MHSSSSWVLPAPPWPVPSPQLQCPLLTPMASEHLPLLLNLLPLLYPQIRPHAPLPPPVKLSLLETPSSRRHSLQGSGVSVPWLPQLQQFLPPTLFRCTPVIPVCGVRHQWAPSKVDIYIISFSYLIISVFSLIQHHPPKIPLATDPQFLYLTVFKLICSQFSHCLNQVQG